MPANPEIEAYIRQAAQARGIDAETAVRVAKSEALNVFDPSRPDLGGDERSSFGPFQLHYAGMSKNMPNAGLGDEFTKATGLHASDPSTWKQQVDFALDTAKKDGWRQWMGAANTGIPRWAGITDKGVGGQSTSPYTIAQPGGKTASMQGPINIRHPPNPAAPTPTGAVGGYGLSPDAPDTAVASASPYALPEKKERTRKDKMLDAIQGIGEAGMKQGASQWQMPNLPAQPGAAIAQAQVRPAIDPQQAEMRRQQLAMALQRLNQGGLVG